MRHQFSLILCLAFASNLQAQIGKTTIGTTNIGHAVFAPAIVGKSTTPACNHINDCNNTGCSVYIFIGSGNWLIPGNWDGGHIPPTLLSGCNQIVIAPSDTNAAVLAGQQTLMPGTNITVMTGKKLIIQNDVIVGQ